MSELRKHKHEIRDCIYKQRRSDPRLEGMMTVLLNCGATSAQEASELTRWRLRAKSSRTQ